jgi:protein-S-isoprenylcysteine O-methyltransferase Ste14
MLRESPRHPGVRIPPPLFYLLSLLSGFILQRFVPIPIVRGAEGARTLRIIGWVVIVLSLLLFAWAVSTFKRLRTAVIPVHPATLLVEEGPYKFTRNPMYLGMTILYVGITLAGNTVWPLLFLPEAIALVYFFAIRLEEHYLRYEFGDAYAAYCARVRRWI